MTQTQIHMTDDEIIAVDLYLKTGNNGISEKERSNCHNGIKKIHEAALDIRCKNVRK